MKRPALKGAAAESPRQKNAYIKPSNVVNSHSIQRPGILPPVLLYAA